MGRYLLEESESINVAEAMFERLIGYSYANTTYKEIHAFIAGKGSQVQLKHMPIEILACDGFLDYPPLLYKDWTHIPIEIICQLGQVLDIPPSVFQVAYKKVRVTYLAGHATIPVDIVEVIKEISHLLQTESVSEWNLPLSLDTRITIGKYKK